MALLGSRTVLELTVTRSKGLLLPDGLGSAHRGAPKSCFLLVGMALLHVKCHLGLPVPPWARLLLKKRMVEVGGGG